MYPPNHLTLNIQSIWKQYVWDAGTASGKSFRIYLLLNMHMNSPNQTAATKILPFRNSEPATVWKEVYDIKPESL